jgi:predicted metal-dependent phosphoesterase TrpH
VDVLALTDHDVTDGIAEARATAVSLGMRLIAGVDRHLAGPDGAYRGSKYRYRGRALQQGLARLREFRHGARWKSPRLQKKNRGPQGARRLAKGTIVSRTHFARFLVEQGYVRGMQQAFKQFLGSGKPGHVPGQWATLDEAVGWIRSAGGQAVVAHPARYKLSAGKLLRLFGEFRECGGEAIEVISGSHTPESNRHFARLAAEQDFLASAGSDYHGPEKTWMDLEGCRLCPVAMFRLAGLEMAGPVTRQAVAEVCRTIWLSIFNFIRSIRSNDSSTRQWRSSGAGA